MEQSKETVKSYFNTNDKPTESQFSDLIDSYLDAKQSEGEEDRRFIIDAQGKVSVSEKLTIPEYTLNDIQDNKLSLVKDAQVISEIDLSGIGGGLIKKKEITLTINDLNTTDVYELLPATGENTVQILDKVIFDINIITPYNEFAMDTLFNVELNSELLLHRSPFVNINTMGRSINLTTKFNSINLSEENFNKPVYLKPNFNATLGELTVKVIVFYTLVQF